MLREIKATSQKKGEPKRRWFASEEMDLFVWFNENNEVISYQLSYNKPHAEKAISWKLDEGYSYLSVDEGSKPGHYPESPLLNPDTGFNPEKLLTLFKNNLGELDSSIQSFIISGIEQHIKI